MANGRWTELTDRGVVEVGGPDARHFLQNLLTGNIEKVAPDVAGYGALLTPQGKVQFDFIVFAAGDGFLFDLKKDRAADFATRLGFYRLRAAVAIADRSSERAVIAAWDGDRWPSFPGVAAPDPRLARLGVRAVVAAGAAPVGAEGWRHATPDDYRVHRIALGIPEGGTDFAYGDAFPHDADIDQLGGIDFAKGCYTGQEVVSRMEHRGTARRRIIMASAAGELPPPGTPVTAGGVELGMLASVAGPSGLASIRLDRAGEAIAAGTPILAGSTAVSLTIPAWARFDWPQSGAGVAES